MRIFGGILALVVIAASFSFWNRSETKFIDKIPDEVVAREAQQVRQDVRVKVEYRIDDIKAEPIETKDVETMSYTRGQVRLTEDQERILKTDSEWGGSNAEKQALIDSIPEEAFTSDW